MTHLQTEKKDDVLVIHIQENRISDEIQINELTAEILTLIDSGADKKFLMNFKNVQFMGSAMIGKIVMVSKKCKKDHIDLRFCEVSDEIMEVFDLMKLTNVLQIYSAESEAIEGFIKHKKRWYV